MGQQALILEIYARGLISMLTQMIVRPKVKLGFQKLCTIILLCSKQCQHYITTKILPKNTSPSKTKIIVTKSK